MAYTLQYTLIDNNTHYSVSGYTGTPISVTIPATYEGKSVSSIGNNAFSYCYNLTSITIGNSVTSIGNNAFEGCTSLTNITIPNSVTSIGGNAFSDCTNLASVTIPNSVTSIGGSAFSSCTNLTSITIPNSVTSIGNGAFYYCDNLTSIEIPNSVTSIGHNAFSYCTNLTSITIPNSVTSIGSSAFRYCTNLNSINMISKVPANLASNSFTNIKSTAKFYCYSSALEAYKTATDWSSYKDKFVADDIRLTFINSANAQKNYFASKDEIKTLQNKADIIYVDNKFNEINKKLDTLGNIFNYDEETGTLNINQIVYE